jgi:hypothetical protein
MVWIRVRAYGFKDIKDDWVEGNCVVGMFGIHTGKDWSVKVTVFGKHQNTKIDKFVYLATIAHSAPNSPALQS